MALVKDLTDQDFELFRRLIYEKSGIALNNSKKELLRTRLRRRLEREGYESYREYYTFVKNAKDDSTIAPLLDDISTNLTSFYREINHFHFLDKIIPDLIAMKEKTRQLEFRVWSAGCSSGQEPYTLAFKILENLEGRSGSWQVKLLATDISTDMLKDAYEGLYEETKTKDVPRNIISKYFQKETMGNGKNARRVRTEVRNMITFRRFNLMRESFPFKHQFDFIFCRNVMIYFDRPTQETLVGKYHRFIKQGGYLFIGHSESLTGLDHKFKYIQPTIYQK